MLLISRSSQLWPSSLGLGGFVTAGGEITRTFRPQHTHHQSVDSRTEQPVQQ